jgi:hypothetical protein
MKKQPLPANLLVDLEARQEEVIARLDDLDRAIQRVLAEYGAVQSAELAPDPMESPPEECVVQVPGVLRKAG